MKVKVLFVVLLLLAGSVFVFLSNQQRKADTFNGAFRKTNPRVSPTIEEPKEAITVIATGLEVPWALAFLPNNDLLFTERIGNVKLLEKGAKEPVLLAKISVKQIGESGLHGITAHPHSSQNNFIYIYYTYASQNDNTFNRVVRYTYQNKTLSDQKIIIDQIPGALFHDGGRIKFGPDGFLYITTGDAQNPSFSQNKASLAGKILRVTDDGKIASENPFNSLVYSYGHRNPQGIAWDNQGRLWETEHGSSACDELNRIDKGNNYGWPTIRCDQKQNTMVLPMLQSGSDTWAPAGLAYYSGSLFFAGLRGQALYQTIINGTSLTLKEHFKGEFGRIRDVVLGPDNMLYITTSNRDGRGNPTSVDDRIIRIDPKKLR